MKTAILLAILFAITGCSHKIIPHPEAGLPLKSEAAVKGLELFLQNCNRCHPGGMSGRGPALINKSLPGIVIRFQVRNGLGAMPAFRKKQLSKADLDNLVKYIKEIELRNKKEP